MKLKRLIAAVTAALGFVAGANNAAAQTCTGTSCTGTTGNAAAQAALTNIIEGQKQRFLTGIIGTTTTASVYDNCVKSLSIWFVGSANSDRDSDAAKACRDKRAATEIAIVGLRSPEPSLRVLGIEMLKDMYNSFVAGPLDRVIKKLEACFTLGKEFVRSSDENATVRGSSDNPNLFCVTPEQKVGAQQQQSALPPAPPPAATAPAPSPEAVKAPEKEAQEKEAPKRKYKHISKAERDFNACMKKQIAAQRKDAVAACQPSAPLSSSVEQKLGVGQ